MNISKTWTAGVVRLKEVFVRPPLRPARGRQKKTMKAFEGQTAIVTGATRGIGRASTLAFLHEGARVLGVYGSDEAAASTLLKQHSRYAEHLRLFQCDVSRASEVKVFFEKVEEEFGAIDILVNNAGIRRDAVLALMKLEDWQHVLDVNLTGAFLMAKQAVLLMMKKKYGRIITITSPVARLGFSGQANYAASKAGQIAMMKSLSRETAKKKITVNCVSPGFIDTDFIRDLDKEQIAAYKKRVPMRRLGSPQEVADAVLFLASERASYITGTVLEVSGGI